MILQYNHCHQDQLTSREKKIVNLIAMEYTTIEIANELILSFETIKTQRKRIMDKLRVTNVAGIVREAYMKNYLSYPSQINN